MKISGDSSARIAWDDPRLPSTFWSKVIPEPNSGCWLWLGERSAGGYGRLEIDGRRHRVHRMVAGLVACTDGLFVCHRCDEPLCCNPDHLFIGTHTDNMRDMVSKGRASNGQVAKTHCARGHEYAGENLAVQVRKNGWVYRVCKTCQREWSRQCSRRRRAA